MSNDAVGLDVDVDLSEIEALLGDEATERAQTVWAQKVLDDMNKHCPYENGYLHDSAEPSSRPETGDLVWNMVYAKHVHELDSVKTDINPDALPHWTAAAKDLYMEDWEKYAGELLVED